MRMPFEALNALKHVFLINSKCFWIYFRPAKTNGNHNNHRKYK